MEGAGNIERGACTGSPAATKAAARQALLTGAIVPTLMRLALPTITVLIAQTAVGIAETFYVSYLGTDALVGVSIVFPIWMLMTMMSAGGIGAGVASAVARAVGSGRDRDADDHVFHAVLLALLIGCAFMVAVLFFGRSIFAAMGATGGALDTSIDYSFWLFLSAAPTWVVNLCSAALRGAGDVKTPALVTLVGALVLIPLSPLFIFGFGPFHGFGVAGAGIAVTSYNVAACTVLVVYLARGRSSLQLRLSRLHGRLFREVLGIGIIASVAAAQLNLAVILVTGIMGSFGTASLAGFGIGARLEYLFIPILFGLGSSVLTMVGTCVGAGDLPRAKRTAFVGTLIGAGFTGGIGVILAVFPHLWLQIFSADAAVLQAGSDYLRAAAPFYAAMGTSFILAFVSQGAGRPIGTMLAGTARLAVAAGIGWQAVTVCHAGMVGLSLIVAGGQVTAAAICLAVFQFGWIWPRELSTRTVAGIAEVRDVSA